MIRKYWLATIAAGAVFASAAPAGAATTFGDRTDSPAGGNPGQVAVGDLNGDGRGDVAVLVVNAFSGPLNERVRVGLSDDAGGFTTLTDYPVGAPASFIASGDLDGDGDLDVALSGRDGLTVLRNTGNGTFSAPTTYAATTSGGDLAIGDFTGDGRADVAVLDPANTAVRVFRGKANGSFTALAPVALGGTPLSIAVGDFGGGNRADAAVTLMEGDVVVLRGRARRGLSVVRTVDLPYTRAEGIVTGDFDGDGRDDIALSYATGGESGGVAVLRGRTRYRLEPLSETSFGFFGPAGVDAADFDDDGDVDLVAGNAATTNIQVLENDGTGQLALVAQLNLGDRATGAGTGDLNGDGRPDVVGLQFFRAQISTFLNTTA